MLDMQTTKKNKKVTYSSDGSWSYSLSPRHGRTHMLNDPTAPLDDIQSTLLFLFKKKKQVFKIQVTVVLCSYVQDSISSSLQTTRIKKAKWEILSFQTHEEL